ncbi:MAG TPA: YggS family pyridoxal phosphate-dependent enzyme, partial [Peptococcaceae bacterium]|nr:YggS family pyridoxal phosphate-dependent enzyme [Peptococcaceae bacterium]
MDTIQTRYEAVQKAFEAACIKAGRDAGQVKLIAVSKNFPAEDIQKVYNLGQHRFGENRAQEMAAKYPLLPQDIVWHFIGRLQRNKVKYIIDKASMIHSVDRLDLAREISRQAAAHQIQMPVLV